MHIRNFLLPAIVMTNIILAGCSSLLADQAKAIYTPPVCQVNKNCDEAWMTAKEWMLKNTNLPLIEEGNRLRTEKPPKWSSERELKVIMWPESKGERSISLLTWCYTQILGCSQENQKLQISFKQYLEQAKTARLNLNSQNAINTLTTN